MSEDEDEVKRVDEFVAKLAEYFDTVQIFVTRVTDDGQGSTLSIERGTGNWWARQGQALHWAEKNRERSRQEVRKESD